MKDFNVFINSIFRSGKSKNNYVTNDFGETMTIDSRQTMTGDYMERLGLQVDYD